MDAGFPSIFRGVVEFNGALLHEVWWNVFICQNFMEHFNNGLFGHGGSGGADKGENGYHHDSKMTGSNPYWYSAYLAILMVPVMSCLVHGITSNYVVGYRCAPQFLWVALAYHASGSVLVPALIHAMWYLCDGRLLVTMSNLKNEFDIAERTDVHKERRTPHADKFWWFGFFLIAALYGFLNLVVIDGNLFGNLIYGGKYNVGQWMRSDDNAHIQACRYNEFKGNPFAYWSVRGSDGKGLDHQGAHYYAGWGVECFLFWSACAQATFGLLTWGCVRAGMDHIAVDGEATEIAKQRFADRFVKEARREIDILCGCCGCGGGKKSGGGSRG